MFRLEQVKKVFNKSIEPFLNLLVKLNVTPNNVTTSALLFLIFTVYFIIKKELFFATIMLVLTSVVDAVDGALAKKVGSTRFGDFYDAFIDRLVEAVIYFAISYAYPSLYMLSFLALVTSFMTSYIAARAEVWTIGIRIKYLGIGGRSGRLTILIIAFLLNQLQIGLVLISIVAAITMVSRTWVTMSILRKR